MNKSHKNQSLVCGIVGISLSGISYLIFAFLSIPGFILGIVSVATYLKDKKSEQETSIAALVCGILAIVLGAVAFVLMIINIIIASHAAA
mgnify:CR=1 FL=1